VFYSIIIIKNIIITVVLSQNYMLHDRLTVLSTVPQTTTTIMQ